jgi:AraC-like DNA-binding protein
MTHPEPNCSGRYYEFFKSPVIFNAPVASLAISLENADRILPSANEELAAFDDHLMSDYLLTLDKEDLLTQAKKIIVEHLPSGDATVDVVASELFYSSRNFQRALQKEGTTFTALLSECRMKLATQYIRDDKIDLTNLAFLLGFSELSTFSRSFKKWTGKSPSQYRKTDQIVKNISNT